jgi:homoserine dehydrogenase
MAQHLRIGMFGGGVVGGGVYEILHSRNKAALQALGIHATVAKICVRDLHKPRTFEVDADTQLVTDYDGESVVCNSSKIVAAAA